MKTTVEGLVSSPIILCHHTNFDKKKKKRKKKEDKLHMSRVGDVQTVSGRWSVSVAVSLSHIHDDEAK